MSQCKELCVKLLDSRWRPELIEKPLFFLSAVFTGSRHHSRTATSQQQPAIEGNGRQDAFDNSKPFYGIKMHFDGENRSGTCAVNKRGEKIGKNDDSLFVIDVYPRSQENICKR